MRVGGDFTWPPPRLDVRSIKRLVLVAGGVGINPLISILAHLMQAQQQRQRPADIVFLYSTKASGLPIKIDEILFLSRLKNLLDDADGTRLELRLFLTGVTDGDVSRSNELPPHTIARRISEGDLEDSLGVPEARDGTVCYVCGPQAFTDQAVDFLSSCKGMVSERVLCEKWW